ncbi:MAG: hypothetical protein AB1488_09530 [Nitrospirota bacterium]
MRKNKPIIIGTIGAIGLLIIYFVILTVANSFSHALEQLSEIWYWISILVIGFGVQLGLYSYIRFNISRKVKGATAEVATAGGISTGSMIACCAHHISDVLPIVGLSAAAIFLVKYQLPFILLGIFSNLVGITIMLNIIQKHKLYQNENIFKTIFAYNMKTVRNIAVVFSVVIVSISFFLVSFKTTGLTVVADAVAEIDLPAKINRENLVSITVKPIKFSYNKTIEFHIKIDTHQGSLDFDLTQISLLEDDKGNIYKPSSWEGSPPGGHHRSGMLRFPKLSEKTKFIKLIIKDVYDVPERLFKWDL